MKKTKEIRTSLSNTMRGEIYCPHCGNAKMVVFNGTSGKVSVACSFCHRFYIADFDKMTAEESGAIKSDSLKAAVTGR